MRDRFTVHAIAFVALIGLTPLHAEPDAASTEAKKARIIANLKLAFPALEGVNVTIDEIEPNDSGNLDEGSITVDGRQQQFFVSNSDQKLYFISGEPIDVSRSPAEIEAELARREVAADEEAARKQREIAAAAAGRPIRGNPAAPVMIVEFGDFECPYCSRASSTVKEILEKYPSDVKFVFLNFPLDFHPWAVSAAIAAHCAGRQKPQAFWTLHDNYFQSQGEIAPENVLARSREYLAGSGISMDVWANCAENQASAEYEAASRTIDGDKALGQALGVEGTPGFFVNGRFLSGAVPIEDFEALIARAVGGS